MAAGAKGTFFATVGPVMAGYQAAAAQAGSGNLGSTWPIRLLSKAVSGGRDRNIVLPT